MNYEAPPKKEKESLLKEQAWQLPSGISGFLWISDSCVFSPFQPVMIIVTNTLVIHFCF